MKMEKNKEATHSRVCKVNRNTPAARWNLEMSRRIRYAVERNPEVDITSLLPSTYLEKLQCFKTSAIRRPALQLSDDDLRARLDPSDCLDICFPLSSRLNALLQSGDTSQAILDLLDQGRILYKVPPALTLSLHDEIAAKITHENLTNEHMALAYLQEQLPAFPVPRPHGLLRFGPLYILFTTFIPGMDLGRAWSQLEDSQKRDISSQLGSLFSELRSLPIPNGQPLGSICGEGCKDIRRDVRHSSAPIKNVKEFEDFVFSGSRSASPLYINFLRSLLPSNHVKCVFTHGDVRPANIMVDRDGDQWKIVAIVDWDTSGFYPEYWECQKMTNNFTSRETLDWYEYVPELTSPEQYPTHWLVDRVWDRDAPNS